MQVNFFYTSINFCIHIIVKSFSNSYKYVNRNKVPFARMQSATNIIASCFAALIKKRNLSLSARYILSNSVYINVLDFYRPID